jgi:hypothetical protein
LNRATFWIFATPAAAMRPAFGIWNLMINGVMINHVMIEPVGVPV